MSNVNTQIKIKGDRITNIFNFLEILSKRQLNANIHVYMYIYACKLIIVYRGSWNIIKRRGGENTGQQFTKVYTCKVHHSFSA